MEKATQMENLEERLQKVRRKRIETLCGAYDMMREKYRAVAVNTTLHHSLVATVVESYLKDFAALVGRYNISNRIAKHKIAGLMAANILKHRPVQLFDDASLNSRVSRDNEELALLHGLAVCAEGHSGATIQALFKAESFHIWYEDTIYLFYRRPDSAECFVGLFETISLAFFPSNLAVSEADCERTE